jgi:DNA repair protein RecO (recombination protein O)
MRKIITKCFLLYSQNYLETSALLTLYSLDFGKIKALAKGIKRAKSRLKPAMGMFSLLTISIIPPKKHGGIYQLISVEDIGIENLSSSFSYRSRLIAYYMTELLYILMPYQESDGYVFKLYNKSIITLNEENVEIQLRVFELGVLEALGYGVDFKTDSEGRAFNDLSYYFYNPLEQATQVECDCKNSFSGKVIKSIEFNSCRWNPEELVALKYIMRVNIQEVLAGRELRTRKAFRDYLDLGGNR